METALAILMALGIFVGVPAVIGFAIVGTFILRERQARKARQVKPLAEEPAEGLDRIKVKMPTTEPVYKTLAGAHRKH